MSELEIIKQSLEDLKLEIKKLSTEKKVTLTIKEAAKVIGIGEQKLRSLTFRKDFPATKNGNKKLIIMNLVDKWLYENRDNL